MITLDITPEQLKRAEEHFAFGVLNNSIMHGESNIYGALGEILVADYYRNFGFTVDMESTYDYDLIIENKKIDVKSKKTTVIPCGHYNCSVASYNTKQKCDAYFFVLINEEKTKGYLLGLMPKKKFFAEATFNKKGEVDPQGNGWKFRADCYNLAISKLLKPKK
jgi:hypothetical protein